MKRRKEFIEFEWDKGNSGKNKKHNVEDSEAEEVFFDPRKVVTKDILRSGEELRFILLGKTKRERLLYIVFTQRRNKIRIISARNINKKEVFLYEKTN
ncbi:BrnT family toxin [Candidatus Gottesmanbacteria bacterium]|nr:BrnT family toxin [Candidatus Gottesmanbacteria bacterium]